MKNGRWLLRPHGKKTADDCFGHMKHSELLLLVYQQQHHVFEPQRREPRDQSVSEARRYPDCRLIKLFLDAFDSITLIAFWSVNYAQIKM